MVVAQGIEKICHEYQPIDAVERFRGESECHTQRLLAVVIGIILYYELPKNVFTGPRYN